MKAIWKFELEIADNQTIQMPKGAQILCVQAKGTKPCIWAIVEPSAPRESRYFAIIGTGHPHGGLCAYSYIGTVQTHGCFVWHIFESTL